MQLDRANLDFKVRMKELFHILKSKPELNKQFNSQYQHEIKTMIVMSSDQAFHTLNNFFQHQHDPLT